MKANPRKLRILRAFRPYFRLIHSFNRGNIASDKWKAQRAIETVTISINLLLLVIATWMAFWRLMDVDFEIKIFTTSFPIIISMVQVILTFFAVAMKRRLIGATIERLQAIISKRCESSKESFENYQNVEGSHTHLTQILFKLACLLVGSAYASALLFPISYAIFQFPDPIYWRLPMDVHSLIGWSYTGFLIDWFIQFIAFTCYFSILVASGSLFIGLCLYITGMVEDIKLQLALLDEPLSTKNSVSRLHARSVYAKEIDFHINILELADEVRAIVNEVIFLRLLACSAIVALNLFALELNSSLSMEVVIAIYDLSTVLVMTFIHCYYAEKITEALHSVSDLYFDSTWYVGAFAQDGALLILPIQRAQREFRLVSFDMIDCSLPIFLNIIKTACSYFLIIRSFK